jgi:hypothetical protein
MFYTIGALALHFSKAGCPVSPWQIRRTIERGLLAEPPRVGAYPHRKGPSQSRLSP